MNWLGDNRNCLAQFVDPRSTKDMFKTAILPPWIVQCKRLPCLIWPILMAKPYFVANLVFYLMGYMSASYMLEEKDIINTDTKRLLFQQCIIQTQTYPWKNLGVEYTTRFFQVVSHRLNEALFENIWLNESLYPIYESQSLCFPAYSPWPCSLVQDSLAVPFCPALRCFFWG